MSVQGRKHPNQWEGGSQGQSVRFVSLTLWHFPATAPDALMTFKPLARLLSTALSSHHFSHPSVAFHFAAQCHSAPLSLALWAKAKGCLRSLKIQFTLPQGELLLSDEASHPQGACENIPHKNSLVLTVWDSSSGVPSLHQLPLVFSYWQDVVTGPWTFPKNSFRWFLQQAYLQYLLKLKTIRFGELTESYNWV